jgi:hypothetical protein
MKALFFYPVITIALMIFASYIRAQERQPIRPIIKTDLINPDPADTNKKTTAEAGDTSKAKTDSLKGKKTAKHKNKEPLDYNPYQPPTPSAKPLPYNTYRERMREPAKTDSLGGEILKMILKNNIKHN